MKAAHLQKLNGRAIWVYNPQKVRPLPRITSHLNTPAKTANDTGDYVTQAQKKDEGG